MSSPKPVILLKDTFCAVLQNSVDSKMYQTFCAEVDGERQDIVQGGNLSCGFFVSSLLKAFNLIDDIHLTVDGTVRAMLQHDWQPVAQSKMQSGDVIVWGEIQYDDGPHKHIGFYIGNNQAVSTDSKTGMVAKHDVVFDGRRMIEAVYTNPTRLVERFIKKSFMGVIVEESLVDNRVVNDLEIIKTEVSKNENPKDRWHLYTVKVTESEIMALAEQIKPKWYMHFWSGNQVMAVFKDKTFVFEHNKRKTWHPAIEYGLSQGIPKEQLDFPIGT